MTTISKVNKTPRTNLRSLYRRRVQVAQAIAALEQLKVLRLHRSKAAMLAMLAVDRDVRMKLAA